VGHTGEPLVGHTGEPLSRSRFARVPEEVVTDRRLKPRDIRVFAALSLSCWTGAVSKVGKRLIAHRARCAERLVIESLRTLEEAGHIQKQPAIVGSGTLRSPVTRFRSAFRGESVSSAKSGELRQATQRKHPRTELISRPSSYAAPKASDLVGGRRDPASTTVRRTPNY